MKNKTYIATLLMFVCLLTACPAPEFNHVIINKSNTVLNVEYEYVTGKFREDHSKSADPAKMNFEQYEKDDELKWNNLSPENGYAIETISEETIADANTNEQRKMEVKKVKLKLLPNEVMRAFVSSHLSMDSNTLKSIELNGEEGKLEIAGEGFEQFSAYRPDRFFTDTLDYRIVYR